VKVGRFSLRTLVKVLVFTLISAVFTAALLVKIGNIRLFADTYRLEAEFEDATGVFRGDAVKLAGVDVGRVESAHIENGKAVVSFNVNQDVHLTTSSLVGIRWRNVLGQRFLYVYPGTGGGTALEDGDRIPVTQTETAGDIGEFLNSIGPILRAIDPDKANAFLEAVNTALAGNEANVRQLITDGATLATQLADMDDEIKSLLETSDVVLSTYAEQDDSLGAIIDNFDVVGAHLHEMTADINSLLVNFSDVQDQLNRLLKDNRENIDVSLRDLKVVVRTLERNKKNLETTLCTLPLGLAGYFQTTSWGEWFNVRITQVIVKDPSGNTVFTAKELPGQRSGDYAGAVTGCGDQKTTVGLDESSQAARSAGHQPGAGGPARSDTAIMTDGFESIGGLVRFATREGSGG
jgi:phospholipid/cholesterol/gamma-HCH transport system substrate-binding protein